MDEVKQVSELLSELLVEDLPARLKELEEGLDEMRKIDTIVLHHTACENPVPDIVSYHLRRGMREVFYHYLITMSGELHLGRSIKNAVSSRRPATIEVAIVGRLHINNILPEQEKTLYRLIDDLQQVFDIKDIKGHKDFSPTICPGNLDTDHYQQHLDNIRKKGEKYWLRLGLI